MQHVRSRRVVNKYIVRTPYKDVVKTMRYKRRAYTATKFLAMPRLKKESIKRMADGVDKEPGPALGVGRVGSRLGP